MTRIEKEDKQGVVGVVATKRNFFFGGGGGVGWEKEELETI